MHGQINRGEFVALAYRLGRQGATGALQLTEGRLVHRLHLRRGYMTAAQVDGHWAPLGEILRDAGQLDEAVLADMAHGSGLAGRALREAGQVSAAALEAALRRQAEMRLERLASMGGASYVWTGDAPAPRGAGGVPLSLTRWARKHVEARLDARRAQELCAQLAGQRISAAKHLVPEPLETDETDRRILAAMASPRRLDEIEVLARAPRFRLLAFVFFLRAVGALEGSGVGARPAAGRVLEDRRAAARRVLGVDEGAGPEQIRRAYHRLARTVHPDARPDAVEAVRRDLALRFAALSEAYRTLTAG
jgi:hypothetical protein